MLKMQNQESILHAQVEACSQLRICTRFAENRVGTFNCSANNSTALACGGGPERPAAAKTHHFPTLHLYLLY